MKAYLLHNTDIDKARWDTVVAASPQRNIFVRSWLLDAMQLDWQGIVVEDAGEWLAVMPLYIKKKYGLRYSLQPTLVKYWGIYMAEPPFRLRYDEYTWKKKVIETAVAAIPSTLIYYIHNFHPGFDYPLPFHWAGYTLESRYTYYLDLSQTYATLEKNYSSNTRNLISKARRMDMEIKDEYNTTHLQQILRDNERAEKKILDRKHFSTLEHLADKALAGNSAFIKTVFLDNTPIASSFFLHDTGATYFLLQSISVAHRKMPAAPLLLTEAIRTAQLHSQKLDFLGSMTEGIEYFFRRFGAVPVSYPLISKVKKPFNLLRG